jgi:hypothetical protein
VIDISKLYKKLQESNLDFFEDGGPYDPYTDTPDGVLESQYLGNDTLSIPFPVPSQRDIDYALNYTGDPDLQPIDQSDAPGVMIPNIDLSQGNTSSVFQRVGTTPHEIGTLADELKASLGISVPTNNSMVPTPGQRPAPVAPTNHDVRNYDSGSFADAWKQARSSVGPNGTFTYKGKRYNTLAATDSGAKVSVGSGARIPSRSSSGLSGEQVDYNNLVNLVEGTPNIAALKNYSPQALRQILSDNVGSGEAQQLVRQALNGTSTPSSASVINQSDINKLSDIGLPKKRDVAQKPASTNPGKPADGYNPKNDTFTINGTSYTRARLNAVNAQLAKSIEGGESKHGFPKIYRTQQIINRNKELMEDAQNYKNEQKINDMRFDSASQSIIYNGKRYNVNNKSEQDKLTGLLGELPLFGRGNYGSGYDKYNKIKNALPKKALGGEIPSMAIGGPLPLPLNRTSTFPGLQDAMSSLVDPTTGQVVSSNTNQPNQGQLQLTPEMDARLQASGQNQFQSFIGDNGQMRIQTDADRNLNIGTAQSDIERYYVDPKTGQPRPITIKQGQNYDLGLDALYNSQGVQNTVNANSDKAYNQQMAMLGMLQNQQSYDVPEDLRMLGQSLAFNANKNSKYTNDVDRGIATGLNVTRGVAAGLDALVGGARELYSGYAYQQRQQNTEDAFYRGQRRRLENQQLRYADGGEVVNQLLAMFAEGGQNPKDLAAAFGKQDDRPDLSESALLTGEYIQQAPPQAVVEPNAELERNEFVQHTDGEVQQVVGRTHGQGGERLALEPGTMVVSDKVKLGAKNAKLINKEYDLGIKAGDTYAKVVEKYTKKIGLSKLNDDQEGYFDKLKKVSDQAEAGAGNEKESQTAEINNSFLSDKINDLEQQKALAEQYRSEFTQFIYQLQEGSKPTRDQGAIMEDGGLSNHALGDQVPGPDGPMTLEELIALNNAVGTNSKDPSIGGNLWDALYYQPMNKWQQYLGQTPTNRQTHLDYQKDVVNLLNPQLNKLIENGEMGLTNKHRALLKEAGVKDAGNKTSFKQLSDADKKKLSNVQDFITQGYEDGLAGHRGVTVLPGDLNEEDYNNLTGQYDKLTDADGRKIYAQYNDDGTIQKTKDGKIVFYYPQTGNKVPEEKAPAPNNVTPYQAPAKKTYVPPYLPSQRPVAPTPASPIPLYQTRLDRLDPVRLGYDQQLAEINRQASTASTQLDGLTDTQRAAAQTNISANTQKSIADVINNVSVQNAMNQFQTQQANLGQSNAEEQARLNNARYSDELWMKTEANQEADMRDYQEALQRNQLGRFRYLQKDRQINDMIENFKVGADGSIQFDASTATPIGLTATGDTIMQDVNGRTKVVKTTKTDKNGNVVSGSTTVTKKP